MDLSNKPPGPEHSSHSSHSSPSSEANSNPKNSKGSSAPKNPSLENASLISARLINLRNADYYKECFCESRDLDRVENENINTKRFIRSFISQLTNKDISVDDACATFLNFLKEVTSVTTKDSLNYVKPLLVLCNKILVIENISPSNSQLFLHNISSVLLNLASKLNESKNLTSLKASNYILGNLLKLDLINEQMFSNPSAGLKFIASEIYGKFFKDNGGDLVYNLNHKAEIKNATLLIEILGKLKLNEFNHRIKETCIALIDLEEYSDEDSKVEENYYMLDQLRVECLDAYASNMKINESNKKFWINIKESFDRTHEEHVIECMALVKINPKLIEHELQDILSYTMEDDQQELVIKLAGISAMSDLLIDAIRIYDHRLLIFKGIFDLALYEQNQLREKMLESSFLKLSDRKMSLSSEEIWNIRVLSSRLSQLIDQHI
jgi:hypothetical protein